LGLGFAKGIHETSKHAPMAADAPSFDELQRHFARELHDQVAQPLLDLVLEIHELRLAPAEPRDVRPELGRLEESARKVLRQTREMMVGLRERGELRMNFEVALKNELASVAGDELNLQITSRWPQKVNAWAAVNLLRIVKQAVANARRHGRAGKIDVFLDLGAEDDAVIVVLDDGVGIDGAPGGLGVLGMQERAAILGGTLSASPREAGGTRIEVRVPAASLA
jgi:two-component system sensor histidine kinase UhpB